MVFPRTSLEVLTKNFQRCCSFTAAGNTLITRHAWQTPNVGTRPYPLRGRVRFCVEHHSHACRRPLATVQRSAAEHDAIRPVIASDSSYVQF